MLVGCAEALQCPTLFNNGHGDHRIEGIGDKHIPVILNVKDQDIITEVDDKAAISIFRFFNTPEERKALLNHGIKEDCVDQIGILEFLVVLILSVLLKWLKGSITVATDSAEIYQFRLEEQYKLKGKYTVEQAYADYFFRYLIEITNDHALELTYTLKKIHNLKYFTWVEQRVKSVEELDSQFYDDDCWVNQVNSAYKIDELIKSFNQKTGLLQKYQ